MAAEADELLQPAVAWAVARAATEGNNTRGAGVALVRWWRRFSSRPPLLSGDEIADLLALPAGPARAAAVRALRFAQACGEVRTGAQARRFLREKEFR